MPVVVCSTPGMPALTVHVGDAADSRVINAKNKIRDTEEMI